MEKIQKPYVSSDSRAGEYRVLDSSGRVDKIFSDMEAADFYLDKNYDRLMKQKQPDMDAASRMMFDQMIGRFKK